ncbi:MAG: LptF/LptG family permease [Bacteroidetes bacterium]|nr:LptF/LptG family permease [Bacteroidota bacterium]
MLKSFFGPLIATFFVSLFILLMQFLWKYIDDLAGKGLEWNIIAELILYASARLVPMALPLAILLSSIMTFGNMGEHFELTAVKSAGISLQRFMKPLIILTVIISIAAFYYSDYVIPYTNLKTGALIYDVKNQRPELQIKEGIFYNGIEGYSIKIAKKNYKTNLLQNIMIYDHTDNKTNVKVTIADSGYMRMTADERNLILTLYNGYTFEEVEESKKKRKKDRSYPNSRQIFEKQVAIFELTGLDFNRTDEDLFKQNFQMLNLAQLEYAEDSLQKEYNKEIKRFAVSHKTGNYFKKETVLEDNRQKYIKIARIELKTSNKKKVKKRPSIQEKEEPPLDTIKVDSSFFKGIINIYNNQSKKDKLSIISHALTYARTAQNNISNTTKTFYHRAERIRRHQIEWHRKFSLSFACLVFFFIGAPFGAIVRKGGFGTPVVISVLFFILYYILSISGEKFAREGVMPAYIGMWLSSFILMPLGIFLTYKATTDSVILNSDTYLLFFKKLFKRFRKKSD